MLYWIFIKHFFHLCAMKFLVVPRKFSEGTLEVQFTYICYQGRDTHKNVIKISQLPRRVTTEFSSKNFLTSQGSYQRIFIRKFSQLPREVAKEFH